MVIRTKDKTIKLSKLNIGLVVILLLAISFFQPGDYSDSMVRVLGMMTVVTYGVVIWTWYTYTKKIVSLFFIFLIT